MALDSSHSSPNFRRNSHSVGNTTTEDISLNSSTSGIKLDSTSNEKVYSPLTVQIMPLQEEVQPECRPTNSTSGIFTQTSEVSSKKSISQLVDPSLPHLVPQVQESQDVPQNLPNLPKLPQNLPQITAPQNATKPENMPQNTCNLLEIEDMPENQRLDSVFEHDQPNVYNKRRSSCSSYIEQEMPPIIHQEFVDTEHENMNYEERLI